MWFWTQSNAQAYDPDFEYWYENEMPWMDSDGTWKKGTKNATDENGKNSFTAGSSISDKMKMWADSQYKREDAVLDTITGTAKKVVGIGQNLALLGLAGAGILIYIKYFYKGGKK